MLLIGVNENNRWLGSNWSLTYRVGWNEILKACAFASRDYGQFEILVDDAPVSVKSEEESMNLPEARKLTFRGISSMLKVPVMITVKTRELLRNLLVKSRLLRSLRYGACTPYLTSLLPSPKGNGIS